MADKQEDLDLDVKSGNKLNTILLIVLIVLVLVIGGVGAAWYLLGGDDKPAGEEGAQQGEAAEQVEAQPQPAHYLKLEPEFVVNFEDPGKARYLQVEIQLMARDPKILEQVKTHMPVIRSELLILLSEQTFEKLSTREGKLKLRDQVLKAVNGILEPAEGEHGIEQVYFTSLIMQ